MLLFSLDVIERVRFIVERMRGQLVSDVSTVHALGFFRYSGER